MKLDKLSLQFALHETDHADGVLEAYERLIHDAMSGDQTLFTNAEGIERLWEVSAPPRGSARGPALPGRLVGPVGDQRPHRPPHMAPALRAGMAPAPVISRHARPT
jgi:hypothetical protein